MRNNEKVIKGSIQVSTLVCVKNVFYDRNKPLDETKNVWISVWVEDMNHKQASLFSCLIRAKIKI